MLVRTLLESLFSAPESNRVQGRTRFNSGALNKCRACRTLKPCLAKASDKCRRSDPVSRSACALLGDSLSSLLS